MSSLLNASTSIDALPGLVTFVAGVADASRFDCSIVSSVFEKGLRGACEGLLTASSSDVSEVILSNGSSSLGIGVGGFAYTSSPIVEEESGMEGVEGEGGGGDCTRTFLAAFLSISGLGRFVVSARGCDC